MKKQLGLFVTAIALSVTATTSFAVDLYQPTGNTDFDTLVSTTGVVNMTSVTSSPNSNLLQNVGIVYQSGDGNIGAIDQSIGTGNFAAIIQASASSSGGAVGYIIQSGNANRAVVYQH